MKIFFVVITLSLSPFAQVLAHEEETEFTDLTEADWVAPLIATLVICGAIIAARIIRARARKQIINNKLSQKI